MRKSIWFLMILMMGGMWFACPRTVTAQDEGALPDDGIYAEEVDVVTAESAGEITEEAEEEETEEELSSDITPVNELPEGAAIVTDSPPAVVVVESAQSENIYDLSVADPLGNGEPADSPGNLISISLDTVPVPDVVNMFSRISGANIIVAGNFTNHFVTANLRNVEWKSALKLSLGSVGLSLLEDPSGILMVVTSEMYQEKLRQIEETKPLVTRSFQLKYMNAVDLVEQIRGLNILSPRGTIITSQSRDQHQSNLKSSALTTTTIQNPSITTEVIVSDILEYVDKVDVLIKNLDKREPQVFIEARIIDVVSGSGQKLGFDWEMLDRFGVTAGLRDVSWSFADEQRRTSAMDNRNLQYDRRSYTDEVNRRYNIDGQPYEESVTTYEEQPPDSGNWVSRTTITPTRRIDDTINRGRDITADRSDTSQDTRAEVKMGSAILSVTDAALFLSALRKDEDAKMISHPLLIVGNRVEAKIHVGQRYPTIFSTKDTDTSGGISRDSYSETVEWNDLGLTLWVIPEIDLEDDTVRLTVNPQMSTHVKDITTPQGSVYPVISTRHLSSRVNVPNAHTVVIGGLMDNSKVNREKRVPLLGDIPLLGLLFRHTEKVNERSNLLILLTPTILDETEPLTGLEVLAQHTVDEFEYLPLSAKKTAPTTDAQEEDDQDVPAVETVSEGETAAEDETTGN